MDPTKKKYLLPIVAIVVAALVLFSVYVLVTYARTPTTLAAQSQAPAFVLSAAAQATSTASTEPRTPPRGYTEYQNTTYGFSLFYPSDLSLSVSNGGGDSETIVLQDVKTVRGFQVFIVPYSGTQVTEQRFLEDEPSGVSDDLQNITVDGAAAAAFYSTDPDLGDTYEAWFIHGGYLYEVTTLKPLASWLSQIMETWQFT
jgi:hypothetical protein